MKNKLLLTILIIVISIGFPYLAISFIKLNFNFYDWTGADRASLVLFVCGFNLFQLVLHDKNKLI